MDRMPMTEDYRPDYVALLEKVGTDMIAVRRRISQDAATHYVQVFGAVVEDGRPRAVSATMAVAYTLRTYRDVFRLTDHGVCIRIHGGGTSPITALQDALRRATGREFVLAEV